MTWILFYLFTKSTLSHYSPLFPEHCLYQKLPKFQRTPMFCSLKIYGNQTWNAKIVMLGLFGPLSGSDRGYFFMSWFFWGSNVSAENLVKQTSSMFIWSRSADNLLCVVKNTSTSLLLCHNIWHKQTLLYRAECSKSSRSRLGSRSATRSLSPWPLWPVFFAQRCVLVLCPLSRVFVFTEKLVVNLQWIQLKR